ncbi:MAG TPA: AMP-binding protein, partial [Telmatospirillum sp.]|nr:AMP-binding protein [Telmatospirillum sp.]
RAALFCRDSYNFAVGLFGLLQAGAAVVLPPNGQPGTLNALSGRFDRLVDDDLLERLPGQAIDLAPLATDEPSLHFFTSGSSGGAKCVTKTLGMMERELSVLDSLWPGEVGAVLATVSHQHLYGLTFKIFRPLATGCPFTTEIHELWETLLAALPPGATVISSPAHLGRLGGIAPLTKGLWTRRILSAGAPLSAAAAAQAASILGCLPTEIFGSTETGVVATRHQLRGEEPWSLLPGVEMKTDGDGRLSVRAPHIGAGWLLTADRVAAVSKGFRFLGRVDQVVKVEGKRIDLRDVEQALLRSPLVEAVAVAVLPGDPPRLAAAVVPSREGAALLARLGAFRFGRLLRQGLAAFLEPAGRPRLWRFVTVLPVAAMGKRRNADILALFGAGI